MVADGGEGFLVRGDHAAVRAAQGTGRGSFAAQGGRGAGADQWVAVSQAQASWMTRRGEPDRSTGPDVRFPAPVMAALSSPNVVSDALHLVRYVSRTASAGAAW